MPTREDYLRQPLERRLARLAGTADELTEATRNRSAAQLARRPETASWSATEIICHLRDVEELFRIRFHTILALGDPKILTFGAEPAALAAWGIGGPIGHPLDPDRWAEERQYARNDPEQRPHLRLDASSEDHHAVLGVIHVQGAHRVAAFRLPCLRPPIHAPPAPYDPLNVGGRARPPHS